MRAIKIEPGQRSVELVEVEQEDVGGAIGSEHTETIDLDKEHCLVIDDGGHTADHPTRFRFTHGPVKRPFFGTAMILGVSNGNWAPATLEPAAVSSWLVWEEWDGKEQRYAAHVSV